PAPSRLSWRGIQEGIVVVPGRLGISPNPFHRREALSCRLQVHGKMAGEHLPHEGRDAPLFLCGERLEGFILPVFKQNVGLMHTFLPNRGACITRVTRDPRVSGRGRTGGAPSSHNSSPRRQASQGRAGTATGACPDWPGG